jgi:hypothetical protein
MKIVKRASVGAVLRQLLEIAQPSLLCRYYRNFKPSTKRTNALT